MKINIITESTADITKEQAKEMGITILPIPIRFGEDEYLAGETLDNQLFYKILMESDEFPKTSQITPFVYEQAIAERRAKNEDVLIITISKKLSGCYQNAIKAAYKYADHVKVIDSESASLGQRILVEYAFSLIKEGLSLDDIVIALEKVKERIHVLALVDTLDYLVKGGRLSKAAAIAGKILSIKPIISVQNGKVEVVGKARGTKAGFNSLKKLIKQRGEIDGTLPMAFGYSGLSDVKVRQYLSCNEDLYLSIKEIRIMQMGSAIGAYTGPNVVGLAWFTK